MYREETICAPATPPVNSTLAIIRISGPETLRVVRSIFTNPEKLTHRHAAYGSIVNNHDEIDNVIIVSYHAPESFTGEDMAEIFCHGNRLMVSRIMRLLHSKEIRLAEPGEFSQRAFLNGKMDLTEAEAINHIITARSEWEIDAALRQMHGSLKIAIEEIKERIILLKADIEAAIDFIDQEIEFISPEQALSSALKILSGLESILLRCETGEKLSQGIDITITGKPNAGKSSMLNLILNRERAIVSDIPGTTRDVIREDILIDGFQINLYDTAGIGHPSSELEKIGIDFSHKSIEKSSIVLMLIDATTGITDADISIIDEVSDKETIYIINKTDLVDEEAVEKIENDLGRETVHFSAIRGIGLSELKESISGILKNTCVNLEDSFVSDMRITDLLQKSVAGMKSAVCLIEEGAPNEITAFELNSVMDNLSEITGEITPDDILESIFSRFCIGK